MTLYLIDGYSFVFRAYHSLPPLTNPQGDPVGAVYGFTNMLYKFIMSNHAEMLAVILDSGQKNFRHDIFPEYKSNRPEAPEDLVRQFPIIKEVIEAFNIKYLDKNNFEADDIIATLAKQAVSAGIKVKIVSSDKDLMQLIDNDISMYDSIKEKEIDINGVVKKFAIKPEQVVDYLSIVGDSADFIPGVKGIGAKGAADLLNEFGSLANIYKNIDLIKPDRRRNLLLESKENAFLSQELITLKTDVDLGVSLEDLKVKQICPEKLQKFLSFNGFKALQNRFTKDFNVEEISVNTEPLVSENIEYKKISSTAEIEKIFPEIYRNGILAIHYDQNHFEFSTPSENYRIACSTETSGQGSLLPSHNAMLSIKGIFDAFKDIFADRSIKKIFHNVKETLRNFPNIEIKNYDELSAMAYSLATGRHKYTLEKLIEVYLDEQYETNSFAALKLFKTLQQELQSNSLLSLYQQIDKRIIPVISDIEKIGVKIDEKYLLNLTAEFQVHIKKIADEIYKLAGKEFNIGSPKQLAEVLFEDLGIEHGKKSKKGSYSTGVEVLEDLDLKGHVIAGLILKWRQYSKLVSTYTESLPKAINKVSGRVHTTLNLTETSTGRLSSTNPNLQNIPIRTEEGQRIRDAFIVENGNLMIGADYSQIELRLLAGIANITTMQEAFKNDVDIHAMTASQMFSVPLADIDSTLRRKAKTINFGIIYGISAHGLAQRLRIGRKEAQDYINSYFEQYPGIQKYMDEQVSFAKQNGYVYNVFGRRCFVNGINDKNFAIRGVAERAAINAPLQSSAADIIKLAMIKLPASIRKHMILQIHDELLFEVPENDAKGYAQEIQHIMEKSFDFKIPLKVDVKTGKNWGECH